MITKKQTLTLIVVATSAAAIAFFSYKAYKIAKSLNDGIITGEELELELEVHRLLKKANTEYELSEEESEEMELELLESLNDSEMDFDEDDYVDDYMEEGVDILRFPPNSEDALIQYKEMRLAEFDTVSPAKRTLFQLFKVPFYPSTQYDSGVIEHIAEERGSFFGRDSLHNRDVSIAELILYFAKMADYDLDRGIEFWTNLILHNLDVSPDMGGASLGNVIDNLVNHTFAGRFGYGMFALTDEGYDKLLRFNQEGPITFLKQYNVFLEIELEEEKYVYE